MSERINYDGDRDSDGGGDGGGEDNAALDCFAANNPDLAAFFYSSNSPSDIETPVDNSSRVADVNPDIGDSENDESRRDEIMGELVKLLGKDYSDILELL